MAANDLTAQRLRELLHYDPETGVFTRKACYSKLWLGAIAGTLTAHKYVTIRIDGYRVKAHRLAWLYVTGSWPENFIDHINGIRFDNRFANLRDVTASVNSQNIKKARGNSGHGVLGVGRQSTGTTWIARIRVGGVAHYLGNFPTAEDAHAAYVEAKRRLHEGCTI